jgi:hypothetical protein
MREILAVGLTLCSGLVLSGDLYAFSQPRGPACEMRPNIRDFGAPEGCGSEPGQHTRGLTMTSLATSSGTVVPRPAIVVMDCEYVRLDQFPVLYSHSSG